MEKIFWNDLHSDKMKELILNNLPSGFEVVFPQTRSAEEHKRLIADADYVIAGASGLTREILTEAKKLKMIQKFGVGLNKIDLEAAKERNIPVFITAGANASCVAEMALGLMISVNRCIAYVDRSVRRGEWLKTEMRTKGYTMDGKEIGFVGFGNIAKQLHRMLKGFEVTCRYYDAFRMTPEKEAEYGITYCSLEELMQTSDIITVHAPLTEQTKGMINERLIGMMQKDAILINTARGGVVDEQAMIRALQAGQIRGAGLDTYENEPLEDGSPLRTMENVVLTCHCGGSTIDNMLPRLQHTYGNILKFAAGEAIDARDVVK